MNIAGTCVGFLAAQAVRTEADVRTLLLLEAASGASGLALACIGACEPSATA